MLEYQPIAQEREQNGDSPMRIKQCTRLRTTSPENVRWWDAYRLAVDIEPQEFT